MAERLRDQGDPPKDRPLSTHCCAMSISAIVALMNSTRILSDLHTLSSFGRQGPGAVSRPALSEPDVAARQWVASRMEAAGLFGVQCDGLGSVYGSAGLDNVPALLMGSHTDTRPEGAGWLDGALGLAYALEAARVLQQGGASEFARESARS